MELSLEIVKSALDREQAQDLRRSVLCGELHWPREVVQDESDLEAVLALASLGPKPVGSARLALKQGHWHIEVLAVLERFRGQGVGSALLMALEEQALALGASQVRVMAPQEARAYFEKKGYQPKDESYLEKWIL